MFFKRQIFDPDIFLPSNFLSHPTVGVTYLTASDSLLTRIRSIAERTARIGKTMCGKNIDLGAPGRAGL